MEQQSHNILTNLLASAGISLPEERIAPLAALIARNSEAFRAVSALDLTPFEPAARFRPPPPPS